MKIWVDAQLSPLITQWLSSTYGMEAVAVRDLRLRDARDRDIFLSAREAKVIILTKDRDMADQVMPVQNLKPNAMCGKKSRTAHGRSKPGAESGSALKPSHTSFACD